MMLLKHNNDQHTHLANHPSSLDQPYLTTPMPFTTFRPNIPANPLLCPSVISPYQTYNKQNNSVCSDLTQKKFLLQNLPLF